MNAGLNTSVKAIVFDTDEILIDSARIWRRMRAQCANARGLQWTEIYLLALNKLGVLGDEAVGIEKSANGMRALRAAGMWVVAAPCPQYPLTADMQAIAHRQIARMEHIDSQLIRDVTIKTPYSCI